MDIIEDADGLVVVCDLPMISRYQVKSKQDHEALYHTFDSKVVIDDITHNAQLNIIGVRQRGYYKVAALLSPLFFFSMYSLLQVENDRKSLKDEVQMYDKCVVEGRKYGLIVGGSVPVC